ncbi:MAG: orotate phosphoribosyltransferase [Eubacteriales bacterium]|jgi:orotate phosphoribosyltransferase
MEQYKKDFIDFMVSCGVLTFGDFVTKSGRKTPYFINTGNYKTGSQLNRLGHYYARCIYDTLGDNFDLLFGPAYKGIPLAVAASSALYEDYNLDVGYCFNRKEAKDHGEGGSLVGAKPDNSSRVVIIEDVITAGTSIRETVPIIRSIAPEAEIKHEFISVDRMEKGIAGKTAKAEIKEEFGIEVTAIVTVKDIIEHMLDKIDVEPIKRYMAQYCE